MAGLTLKETAAASVPTPATDKATVFIDSADGLPKYKNDAGTVVSLGGSLADGDYGDVTVSSSGTVITIDDDAVTLPKIANQADQTILGNNTGGSASPSALTASQVRTLLGLVPGTDVQAYDADLAAIAALSPSNDDIIQRKAGAWTNRTIAQLVADLGVPTLSGANTWTAQNTFAAGTITTSQPFTISQTWNSGGVTFEGLLLDITSAASAAASLAMNVKVGGTSMYQLTKGGQILLPVGSAGAPAYAFTSDPDTGIYGDGSNGIRFTTAGSLRMVLDTAQLNGNSAAISLVGFKQGMTARTSDGTEAGVTSYTTLTNAGATALVKRTLPTAAAGWKYTFVCMDTDGIKIQAASGDDIRVIDKITATAGYIQSTTIGSTVTLEAVDATTWVAVSVLGVWTDGTFTYDDTGLTTP